MTDFNKIAEEAMPDLHAKYTEAVESFIEGAKAAFERYPHDLDGEETSFAEFVAVSGLAAAATVGPTNKAEKMAAILNYMGNAEDQSEAALAALIQSEFSK